MKKPGLTAWILIALFAGILTGLLVHYNTGDSLEGTVFREHVHTDRYFSPPD